MASASAPVALRARVAGWRRLLGFAIVLGGLTVLCAQLWSGAQDNPPVRGALMGGLVAALATALGTVPDSSSCSSQASKRGPSTAGSVPSASTST